METKYLDSLYLDDFLTLFEKKMSSQNPLKLEQLSDGVLIPLIEKQWMANAVVLNASSEIVTSANFEPLNRLNGYGLSAEIMEEINLDNLSFMEGSFIWDVFGITGGIFWWIQFQGFGQSLKMKTKILSRHNLSILVKKLKANPSSDFLNYLI